MISHHFTPSIYHHFTPSLYHISHHIIMTSVYIISHCHFTHSYHIIVSHHYFTLSIFHHYFISYYIMSHPHFIIIIISQPHLIISAYILSFYINHYSLICDLVFIYFHINSLFSSLSLFRIIQ